MNIEQLFFELLQIVVGTRNTMNRQPTSREWALLFEMSKKHALVAIAFAGVNKLREARADGDGIDEMTYLKWLGLTAKVAQRNKEVNATCVKLLKQYARDGIQCCILKGQGNLGCYPDDLKNCRTPGDIDVWVRTPSLPLRSNLFACVTPWSKKGGSPKSNGISIADGKGIHNRYYSGIRGVIEYVMKLHRLAGTKPHDGVRYHHVDAPAINGIRVEVHFRPLFLDSPIRNKRLQKWFKDNEQFGLHDAKIGDSVLPVPTASFNAVYQLCHIYRHLFDEGIGLRQLLDYFFVLKTLPSSLKGRCMSSIENFGMKKFTGAVMYVLQTVFTMPEEYLICKPNEKEGKFLLNEIMMAGNFGKYDERIKRPKTLTPLSLKGREPSSEVTPIPLKGDFLSPQMRHAWEKTKHNLRLLTHYPEEVLWEPFFRVYHWIWRRFELWRY